MKKSLCFSLMGLMILVVSSTAAFGETVLYGDDCDRPDSDSLGQTSIGSYDWLESETTSTDIRIDGTTWQTDQAIRYRLNATNLPTAAAKVDYDLDTYEYIMSFNMSMTGEFTTHNCVFAIMPRRTGIGVLGKGWIFQENASGTAMEVYFWTGISGQDWTYLGEATTGYDSNYIDGDANWAEVTVTVDATHAELHIGDIIDSRGMGTTYNDGTEDGFVFAARSISADAQQINVFVDDILVTTIPEPATMALLLSCGAFGFIKRRK